MAIWTDPDQDRPASGRFVRNLALSLSGGALLTVLGATAAQAEDGGAASTASDGAGAAQSGDATAVGNRSGTTKTQTGSASGTTDNLQVVNQAAAVGNVGVAIANTGGNTATGNSSSNLADTSQTATGGLIGAVNNGAAANASNGTATISTGHATAIGNQSTTTIDQSSTTSAHGALGGILVVSQAGVVTNAGVALANTGDNTASGNESSNTAGLLQTATNGLGLASNAGRSSNTSDGLATITTGAASATGNQSDTKVTQSSNGDAGDDPGGALLVTQVGVVLNLGLGTAATGGNSATGNDALIAQGVVIQTATVTDPVLAPISVASNSAEHANVSDGAGSVRTGAATATGNQSSTDVVQYGRGHADGIVPITQAALVVNAGAASADTGDNSATGNFSFSSSSAVQTATVGDTGTTLAGAAIAANSVDAGSTSNGSAWVATGDATSVGNSSQTAIAQTVDPSGLVLTPQLAVVANLGLATADTGDNNANGNLSANSVGIGGTAAAGGDGTVLAGVVGASNSASATSDSDGSASIDTGDARGSGNESNTRITQTANASVDGLGLIVAPQVAVVANAGVGDADTGLNLATGNASSSSVLTAQGAEAGVAPGGSTLVALSVVASNSMDASTASDGAAEVDTGAATAIGNRSSTELTQVGDAAIDGLGAIIAPQVGVVVNLGAADADTGVNNATGNTSGNLAASTQLSFAASPAAAQDLVVVGPLTASNSASASNASDGHAKVKTGRATAVGNQSATTVVQMHPAVVEGLGLIVAPQLGAVANVGLADADTGGNSALGNDADNSATAVQLAALASDAPAFSGIILGPATASNQEDLGNVSDGEACVCTGDATASGNISTTLLVQDLDLTASNGVIVVVEAGGVLNLGIAAADTGENSAVGNTSANTATSNQAATINDALLGLPVVGPQTAANGVTTGSTSNGTALVGSGNATAIGNESATDLLQAAVIDGGFTVTSLLGGTVNAGLGIALTGDNDATGNDSTNAATLIQTADGGGIVSNQGEATNDSDGTAVIGNPEDCLDEVPPEPGQPGLPRTGAELEVQAAVGVMLLLLGFGLTRRSKRIA